MASTYLQKFPVPEQFPEILHDLLREILREQPEDIIEFSYRYFKDKQEDASDPTRAQNKNYYGRQIEIQREDGKSEVIPPPKYQGAKADPYKSDKVTQDEVEQQKRKQNAKATETQEKKQNLAPKVENRQESHVQGDESRSHQTQSGKTNKVATSEYYNDLTDKILNTYDDSNDGNQPATKSDENRRQSASNKSMPHKNLIKEEDEILERSRKSKE